MDVLVILTACLCGAVSLTVDDLYPYPHDNVTTADDELLYRNDDGSSPAIQISFSYFNNVQTSAYVNTNGDITFGSSLSRFIPYAFPYGTGDGNYVMIAAFWTDLITTSVGQIWYKLSTSSDLLTRAASDVQSAFSDQNDFNPSMVFIVTWHEVPYYGASGDALLLRNTFQIVLTADGTKSFVMLHYLRLDWARNAMVGFNAGDGLNGYTVNGSLSDDVVNLVNRSNVGVPGKFLFRVDGGTVQPADQTISSNNNPALSEDCIGVSHCSDTNAECTSTGGYLCRCQAGYFDSNGFGSTGGTCEEMNNLKATQLTSSSVTSSSVTISWAPPFDSSQVSIYVVVWRVNGSISVEGNMTVGNDVTSANITGLMHGTTYVFSIVSQENGSRAAEQEVESDDTVSLSSKAELSETCGGSVLCDDAMSVCIAGNTGENVCRCQLGYFDSNSYSSAGGACKSMNGLIAKSFAVGVEGTSTVTIEWVAPSPESKQVKRYEVHWTPLLPNGTGNYSAGNATNVRLIGFVSGQQYAFYVKTIEHGSRRYEQYVQTASKSITMDAGLGVACNASNIACADYNSNCAKTDNGLSTVCRCRASFFDSNGFNTPGGMCINMSTLAVTDLTLVTEGTETVNISWTPPLEYTDQVSRYVVSWTPVTHINGSVSYNALLSTDIQLVGFTPGQTYTFYIYSVESGSRKTEQNISSVPSVITMKPHTPSDFTETDVDGPVITLSWFLHKGVKTFYEVISTPTLGMANVTTESITYSVNVSDGQQYNTSITAVSGNERSDPLYSSFTTVSKTPDPPTLSNTTFCNSTTNESIALVWTAPEYPRGNIQYYVVKSITTGAIYTTISGKTEYVVAGLKPGTLYTFSVASVNDAVTYGNQSDYSKQYECRTDAAISMAPSTLLVTQIQSREFTLNWTKPTITNGALSGYRLTVTDGSACVKEVIFACHTCPLWVAIPYDCPVGTKQTVVVLPIHLDGVFNYTVHDILPYTNYTVSVLAVNAAGDGVPVTEYTATDQEVPQHPTDLNVSVLSATEIFVTWTISGLEPGPTTFELHVIPGIPEINRTETIRGFYTRDYTVKNLEEFRTYTFNITAVTDKGSSGFQQALPSATTQAIVPDTVGNFLVTRPDGPNFATVRVSWQLPSLLDRNSDVTQFVFSYNSTGGNVTSHSEVIAVDSDPNPVTKNVTVVPLNTYIIEVYAVGEDSTGSIIIGTKSMMTYFAPAGPPPLDVDESIIPSTSNIDIQATHTTFALNIEKRFFTNIVYGPIVDYTLVLCKERCTGLDDKSETKAENYLSTLDGWKAAKTKGFSQMYRAMSKSEFDSAFIAGNKAATTFRIVIGKVTNCSQSTKQYCNGPLQVESTYFLKAAICTVGGCTLSSKYGPFSTLEEIPLGANCTVTPTACNESNSECVQGTCVCANGYFDSNGAADAGGCLSTLALGQTCSIGIPDQCADMNADCSGKGVLSCSCKEGFYRSPGGICAAQLALGGSCDSDVSDQCADQNARCGDSDTCVCTAGFYEVGSICSAKLGLGAACNNVKGECETADSECNEKCVCTTGFYDSNGAEPDGTCTPRGNEPELKTYECSLTLIQQFTIEMNDPNSDVAKSIVADLKIILQASLGNTLLAVVLLRLTEGSVNVDYEVTLSSPVTPEALKTAVVNGQKAELNNLAFIVKIDPNSINFNESVQVPCVKTGSNRTDILLNGRCGDHSETGVCVTPNSACVERFGEWSCRCESGFIQTKDQRSCTPVPKVLFAYPNLTVSLQVPKPVGTPIFTIPFANDVANLCTDVPEVNFIKAFTENNFRYEVNCSAVTVILDSALSSSDASFALGIQTKMAFSDLVVADKIVAILETWSDVSIPTELCVTVADGMFSGQLLATLPTLRSGDSYNAPESVKYRLSGENVYSKIAISLTTITGQSSITAYLDTFDITYGSKILTLKVLIIRASMVVTKRENTKSKVIEYSISDPFTLASSDIPLTNLTLGSSDVSIGPGGLDFESGLSPIIFNIEVSVCSMTASTKVVLHITDVNDNPPQFSDTTYSFDIFPTSLSGLLVGVVQATDIDTMTTLTYSVDSSFFSINHQGVIQTLARTELIPFRDISGESKYSANILINVTASDGVKDNTADVIVNLSRQPGTNLGLNFIANVFENMPPGTPVVRANVSGFISYEFASSRAEEYFTINQTTGEVLTKKRLDRENQNEQKLQFAITAFKSSETSCSLTVLGDIEVVVDDVNDNAPVFERSKYTGKIEEGSSTGRTVKVDSGITATDADENPSFTFAIASSNFAIHPETGVITTISELDREVIDIVTLVVTADDGVNTGSVSINITVTDINDNTPTFDFTSGDWRSTSISEGASIGNVVTTVTANDLDEDENGRVFYRIQGDSGYFRIDNRLSGKITVAQITVAHSLDRETIPFHNFTLLARDNGSPLRSVTTTMVVRIIDVNDNDPVFDSAALIADIPEDKSIGSSLFNVSASDKDEGVNGDIASYNFISGNEDGIFSIDNDGVIRCDKNLDYETTTEYKLVTVAKDNGKTPRSSSSTVTIRVTDVNDNAPYFTQDISTGAHYIKIKKSDFSGQAEKPIMVVTALDRDSGLNGQINKPINMSLPTGLSLTLNSSGVMRTKTSDPPIKNLTVILIAMDKGNPPLTSTATLTLEIVEDDSSSGKVKFKLQDIQMSIPENIQNTDIGTLSGDVTSQNGKTVIFDKVSGAENVKVESSGNIKVEDPFDREAIQSTVIVVRATVEDDTDLALVTVTVTDMNDNHPTFGSTDKYRRILKEDIPINTNIVNVLAKDEDEGLNQKITYTIVGSDACFSHFAINSATGVMTLKKNLDREGAFALCDFSVEAADAGSPNRLTAVVPVEVTIQDVNDNSPIFSDQSSGGGYDITVKEDLRISDETESFGFIRDEDIGENGDIDVSVTLDSDCPFTAKLNITTVDIFKIIFTLTSALDFETVRLHTCEVLVFDKGTPSLTSTVDVKVTVTDVNDNAPVFSAKTYAVNVSRDASIDQTLIDEINATDVESQDLTFLFAPTKKDDIAYKDYFSFNFKTASITVKSKLVDFQRDEVVLYVIAVDGGLSTTATVSILITDDNIRPVFDDPEATLQLTEHSSVVNPVFTALATDREGRKGPELCQCIYRFKNPSDIFEINNTTGKISVIQGTDIDREKTAEVTLNVIATDPGGKDSLPLRLNITILDINDHSPVFTYIRDGDYRFILLQVVPVGSTVGTVIAEDADAGENAIPVYSLRGARYSWSPFMNDLADLFNTMPVSISTTNGTITTIASLDINASRNFYIELVVRAEDSKDSLKVTETKVIVQVDYLDPNGYHPKFAHELYRISLPKSSNIGTDLDINVTATDLDTGADGRVSYSIAAGNTRDIFSINSMTGHLSVAFVIDIAADLVNLTIQAEDGGIMPKRGYCSVEIYLTGNAIECSNAVVGTEDKWFTAMTVLAAVLGVCFTVLLVLIFYFIKLRHSYKYPQGPEAYARKQSIYTANLDRSMVHDDGDYAHFSLPSGTFPGNTVPSAGQPFSIYRSMDSLGDDQSGQTRTNRSIEGSVNGFQDFYQHTAQRRNCRANSDSSSNFSDYEPADNPVSPRASSRPPAPHELTNPLSVSFLEPENRSFRRSTYREPTPDY